MWNTTCTKCRFFIPMPLPAWKGYCTLRNEEKYNTAYCTRIEGFEVKEGVMEEDDKETRYDAQLWKLFKQ